jgi:hypothetical protein
MAEDPEQVLPEDRLAAVGHLEEIRPEMRSKITSISAIAIDGRPG